MVPSTIIAQPFITTLAHAASDPFRLLVDAVKDYGIFMLDPQGNVSSWNTGAGKIKGYSAEEVIGRHFSMFYTAEDVAAGKPQQHLEHALVDGRYEEEGQRIRKDGSLFWVIVTITNVQDPGGNHLGYANVTRDITERKLNEQKLRSSGERFRLLVEGVKNYAIFMMDPEGIVETWNSGAELIFGYKSSEVIGQPYSLFFRDKDEALGKHEDELAEAASAGRLIRMGWRVRKDGSRFWANGTLTALYDENGKVRGFAKITSDLTEKYRNDTLLRSVLDNTEDSIISIDHKGTITTFNAAAQKGFGYTQSEVISRHVNVLLADTSGSESEIDLANFLHADTTKVEGIGREINCRRKDGSFFAARLSISEFKTDLDANPHYTVVFRDLSEQKRLDGERTDLLKRLTLQIERMPLAYLLSGPDFRYVRWNPAAEHIFGYTEAEALGKHPFEMIVPGKSERMVEDIFARLAAGDMDANGICDNLTKDGRTIACEWYNTPLFGADGEFQGILSLAQNVTDRKRAEESLANSESRFRRLFEASRDGILIVDGVTRRVVDVNPFLLTLIGYSREELIGKVLWEVGLFQDIKSNKEAFAKLRSSGYIRYLPLVTRDGRHIAVEFFSNGYDVGGLPVIQCNIRDISSRKRMEDAIQLRDRAIQAATQGLMITDPGQPDNPIIYASPACTRITGYAPEEILGRNCRFLQGKGTDPAAIEQIRQAVLAGEPCTVELLNYRKDGTTFWNELSISPVRDDAGRITHFVGVQMDVTIRRNLHEQFRQVQKMEAVGRLAGGIAHDFNNLLTVINGYSDVLLEALPARDPSHEFVSEILKAGQRSAVLTRQLLAFSRQQVLAPTVLDLNAVITDTEKMLCRLVGEDVRLTTSLDPALGTVRADPGQVEQVLMNLTVNARDAMPQGGSLSIETQNVELDEEYARNHVDARPGPHVLLSVTDTGSGIPAELRDKIFEPFFSTKAQGMGTGLGLATVYGIVKQSSGHLAVESEVGVGTTFKVYLPQVMPDVTGTKHPPDFERKTSIRGTETILLVEDEDGVRTLTRRILSDYGYTVLEAADGLEAIRVSTGHDGTIQLLITDVVMPGAGGRAVADILSCRYPGVRILYISGYTDDAVIRHGVLRDGVNFLQKPFSPSSLAHKVREVMDTAVTAISRGVS